MPRPKAILWANRVKVFLDYRLGGGKVNPVANSQQIARSTVRSIVKEFVDLGFSSQPRARVSAGLLMEMQERHLASIEDSLETGRGRLNIGTATDNESERQVAFSEPLPIEDEVRWHLRDTKAESVVREATDATRAYLQQESDAWQALRRTLEEACQLSEREGDVRDDPEPRILPALKRRLQNAFLNPAFLVDPPGQDWLGWDQEPGVPQILRMREHVAIGSPDDHQLVRDGVTEFLANGFKDHQRTFSEIHRLRQDMELMKSVVDKTLREITKEDIRRAICPACPYPEGSLERVSEPL